MPTGRPGPRVWLVVAAWAALSCGGFALWEWSDASPGQVGGATESARPPAGADWEVVAFVHPHCPCTRATLAELGKILQTAGPGVAARVVFVRPPGVPAGWERGESWEAARKLPGASVECDDGGAEARRRGATTSGWVVVSDAAGRVAFRGGIAARRPGETPGRRAVADILAGTEPQVREAPVYGCPLFAPGD